MHQLRLALIAIATVIGSALPASAETMSGNPGAFVYIWIVILVVGIIVFVAGTSIVGQPKK